jgi:hypothetical protein
MLTKMISFGETIKTEQPKLNTRCNTLKDYTTLRNSLQEYGLDNFKKNETVMGGKYLFSGNTLNIHGSPDTERVGGRLPFTFFTVMDNANATDQQLIPVNIRRKYIILRNKPELGGTGYNNKWKMNAKKNPDASMSAHHQFVGVKAMDWDKFNALTFGMGECGSNKKVLKMLDELQEIANNWAKKRRIPKKYLGCYFHIYPFNSVQSLHMHMVDIRKEHRGVAWSINKHKNMPLEILKQYFNEN